jgi:monovalent cation/hydrogen antiporter
MAVSTNDFSLSDIGPAFLWASAGGVLIGLLVAIPHIWLMRHIKDTMTQMVVSIIICYGSFVLGDALEVSGVLVTVVNGLVLSQRQATMLTPDMRLRIKAFWEMMVFLLNGLVFLLIGFELSGDVLPHLLSVLPWPTLLILVVRALLLCLVVIGVRLLWAFVTWAFLRVTAGRLPWPLPCTEPLDWRSCLVIGWSGMRGGISMAAALSVPLFTAANLAFPGRIIIIFDTFCVILVTLFLQGLTLGPLLIRLGLNRPGPDRDELGLATLKTTQAALNLLDKLEREEWTLQEAIDSLRSYYQHKARLYPLSTDDDEAIQCSKEVVRNVRRLNREIMQAKRQVVLKMRAKGEIDDEIFHLIELSLDLEAQHFHVQGI